MHESLCDGGEDGRGSSVDYLRERGAVVAQERIAPTLDAERVAEPLRGLGGADEDLVAIRAEHGHRYVPPTGRPVPAGGSGMWICVPSDTPARGTSWPSAICASAFTFPVATMLP